MRPIYSVRPIRFLSKTMLTFPQDSLWVMLNPVQIIYSVLQLAPLAYDTIVTTMTVGKALLIRRRRGGIVSGSSSMLVQTFIREGKLRPTESIIHTLIKFKPGVFYYILISMANLVRSFLCCLSSDRHDCRSMGYFICSMSISCNCSQPSNFFEDPVSL